MTTTHQRDQRGYRVDPGHGPRVRTDVIDVYVYRHAGSIHEPSIEFLQLLRSREPLKDTWHPVMGHIEPGETAHAAAMRELAEEVGLRAGDPHLLGVWALEQVHPFYIAAIDCIVMSPRFIAEVDHAWSPKLNGEHARFRWVPTYQAWRHVMWPGQRAAIAELMELLSLPTGTRDYLKIV